MRKKSTSILIAAATAFVALSANAQQRAGSGVSPTAGISSTPMQTMESAQIKRTGRQDAVLAGGGIPSLPSIVLPGRVAKPELCTDPAATNNGGALPCVYAPVVPPEPPASVVYYGERIVSGSHLYVREGGANQYSMINVGLKNHLMFKVDGPHKDIPLADPNAFIDSVGDVRIRVDAIEWVSGVPGSCRVPLIIESQTVSPTTGYQLEYGGVYWSYGIGGWGIDILPGVGGTNANVTCPDGSTWSYRVRYTTYLWSGGFNPPPPWAG